MLLRTALLAALCALVFAAVAGAKPTRHAVKSPAVAACTAERTADPAAFQAKYANKNGKHADRRCVTQHIRAATRVCRAERKAGADAFKTKYGKHAMANCIRQHDGAPVPAAAS